MEFRGKAEMTTIKEKVEKRYLKEVDNFTIETNIEELLIDWTLEEVKNTIEKVREKDKYSIIWNMALDILEKELG